jgi:hypothetical protein
MIVGFAAIGFGISCKTLFPSMNNGVMILVFLGCMIGLPIVATVLKKPSLEQVKKKSIS